MTNLHFLIQSVILTVVIGFGLGFAAWAILTREKMEKQK